MVECPHMAAWQRAGGTAQKKKQHWVSGLGDPGVPETWGVVIKVAARRIGVWILRV